MPCVCIHFLIYLSSGSRPNMFSIGNYRRTVYDGIIERERESLLSLSFVRFRFARRIRSSARCFYREATLARNKISGRRRKRNSIPVEKETINFCSRILFSVGRIFIFIFEASFYLTFHLDRYQGRTKPGAPSPPPKPGYHLSTLTIRNPSPFLPFPPCRKHLTTAPPSSFHSIRWRSWSRRRSRRRERRRLVQRQGHGEKERGKSLSSFSSSSFSPSPRTTTREGEKQRLNDAERSA